MMNGSSNGVPALKVDELRKTYRGRLAALAFGGEWLAISKGPYLRF
ncbi:MAG: hypothetical protein ACRDSJ_05405 [Rubrobacteraceae bacterium]